jgi:hypothetical protein
LNYVWINRESLINEIDTVTRPGTEKICFRSGTFNSLTKGLAVSLKSKISFFDRVIDGIGIRDCLKPEKRDYIRVKAGDRSLIFKLRPEHRLELYDEPQHFPEFDFWNQKIKWYRCPENLVEGIAYIENSRVNEAIGSDKKISTGIHVDGNYVGRADQTSYSRYRLRFPAPFSMILSPEGIGRMRSKLKNKPLCRVARYVIPKEGKGVIFDYGNLRVWNAELEPEPDEYSELRDFMRRTPKGAIEREFQESVRSARDYPPSKPWWENLIPLINKMFDFRIDSLMELPEDVRRNLRYIKRTTDEKVTWVKIGRDDINFTWVLQGNKYKAQIPDINPHPWPTISFEINLFAFERLVRRGTYLGFKNPDSPIKDYWVAYLKDPQGEHLVRIFNIH